MSDPFSVASDRMADRVSDRVTDRVSERPVVGGARSAVGASRASSIEPQIRSSSADGGPIQREGDQVEVSFMATYIAKLRELPPLRQELIDRVKGEIARGTYDTDDKLVHSMDEIIADL